MPRADRSRNLMLQLATLIAQRGTGTIDDLWPAVSGYTRAQVAAALANGRKRGLVHVIDRGGCNPAVHLPGRHPESKGVLQERRVHIRPPNSAWELGHSRTVKDAWPPVIGAGRQYAPLGAWNEADETRTAA